MESVVIQELGDPHRLRLLEQLEVLDSPPERRFQLLTDLASSLLETPVALISLVTNDRQFFVSSTGLHQPWAGERQTPLSHSFCQHVVTRDKPLVVSDSESNPLVEQNLATSEIGVKAYLGYPLRTEDGTVLGSFCGIDCQPREWSEKDLDVLKKLAGLTVAELEARKQEKKKKDLIRSWCLKVEKMEALGNLAAGVAHDFNNTLANIQAHVEIAQTHGSNPTPVSESLQHIRSSVQTSRSLIRQLLLFGRPCEEDLVPFLLPEVVDKTVAMLPGNSGSEVKLVVQHQGAAFPILGCSCRIQEVLSNLIQNSKHAMRTREGEVMITTSSLFIEDADGEPLGLEPGAYMRLSVSDRGCGISAENLDRIFHPYFTTKPVGIGTGLGLWSVAAIVHEHGGRIVVSSQVGEGTTIELYFPSSPSAELSAQHENVVSDSKRSIIENPILPSSLRIMVVDDEKLLLSALESLFEIHGYEADFFADPSEAIAAFEQDPRRYGLVVSDQSLPGTSGIELIQELLQLNPTLKVLLCTGMINEVGELKSTGLVHRILEKPFEFSELRSSIDLMLACEK